jgi:hypothetical protein
VGWDSSGSRVRALERQLVGNGPAVAVITLASTPEQIAAAEELIAAAKARGREVVVVRIACAGKRDATTAPTVTENRA